MFNGGLDMGWKRIIPSRWLSRKRPKNFVRGEERSPGSTCSYGVGDGAYEIEGSLRISYGMDQLRISSGMWRFVACLFVSLFSVLWKGANGPSGGNDKGGGSKLRAGPDADHHGRSLGSTGRV